MDKHFKHRENEQIQTTDGRIIYLSRASAVVAEVCLYDLQSQQWYVLLMKRGSAMPDFQGYWCLPCGYLDWDETLADAVLREVFEETGIYLPDLQYATQFGNSPSSLILTQQPLKDVPWFIDDQTEDVRQNLVFHYVVALSWNGLPLPGLLTAYNAETTDVAWHLLQDTLSMQLAFNHQDRLKELLLKKAGVFQGIENTY